jgi:hypothetical protein
MNITDSLPEYTQFATPELALVFASILSANGYKLDANMAANTCVEYLSHPYQPIVKIRDTYVSRQSDGERKIPGARLISSIKEMVEYLKVPTLKVGDYVAEFSNEGVKVGCTFVPWDLVKKIAEKAPKPVTF